MYVYICTYTYKCKCIYMYIYTFYKKFTVARHYIFGAPGNQPAKTCPKVK